MINPQQQQLIAQWNQQLQQLSGQLQQLLQQASAGCQQMIQQMPTDPMPLSNALSAIEQQVSDLRRKADDTFSESYDAVCELGDSEPAHYEMRKSLRAFNQWGEESWRKLDLHWRVEHLRNMWPHVQQAMQKPLPCNRCGAPLRRETPHKSESITCPACQALNQVLPEAVVATYYGSIPHYYAEQASLEKRFAIDRYKEQWEERNDAEVAADRDRSEEPLESLKRREQMELDYWNTYAQTKSKYEGTGPDAVKSFVDSRMKFFYDEMNLNDVWRAAHGMGPLHAAAHIPPHLQNVDDWGPLRQDQLEDNFVHDTLLSEALRDPSRHAQLLAQLGYRDPTHRALVHQTFLRHYDQYLLSPDGQALVSRAAMRAMQERSAMAVQQGAASGLLDPVEGISLQVYGNLQAQQPNVSPAQFQQLLAQHQMDQTKWDRVQKGWIDRMSKDTTGAIATEYSKAFMNAGQGQFGQAGQAAAAAMGSGGMANQAAAGGPPVSFEKYAEISGAMAAWSRQGKDISAMLHTCFNITAQDFSNIGMYWSTHMMQDLSMYERLSELTSRYEQQYLAQP